jgi:hypothetical protein
VAEGHARDTPLDPDELGTLGRGQVGQARAPRGGGQHRGQVAGALQRRDEQQVPCGRRERGDPRGVQGVQAAAERQDVARAGRRVARARRQRHRQLEQGERVALRLGEHASGRPGAQQREVRGQQGGSVTVGEGRSSCCGSPALLKPSMPGRKAASRPTRL